MNRIRLSKRPLKIVANFDSQTVTKSKLAIPRKETAPVDLPRINLPPDLVSESSDVNRPDLASTYRSVYEIKYERSNPSPDDYDEKGNLKPLPPPEVMTEIAARWAEAGRGSFYEPLDSIIWEKYRRPDNGPERSLSAMERERETLFRESIEYEAEEMEKQIPYLFKRFVDLALQKLTRYDYGGRPLGPVMQPIPQGYFNHSTKRLPHKLFLRFKNNKLY